MRKIPDSTRSNSGDDCKSQNTNSRDNSEEFAHIKSANRKVRTLDILRNYGLKIENNHQRPKWAKDIICPFPFHKGARERTPSFGYCFVSDHWHCFGCGKSGRAVEFISLYEGVSRTVVAEKILEKYGDDIDLEDSEYVDNISPILFDGSKYLQTLIKKYKHDPKALKDIDKLIWWLDFYLMHNNSRQVNPDKLKIRIDRIKELYDSANIG
jgi:hypothetical protein